MKILVHKLMPTFAAAEMTSSASSEELRDSEKQVSRGVSRREVCKLIIKVSAKILEALACPQVQLIERLLPTMRTGHIPSGVKEPLLLSVSPVRQNLVSSKSAPFRFGQTLHAAVVRVLINHPTVLVKGPGFPDGVRQCHSNHIISMALEVLLSTVQDVKADVRANLEDKARGKASTNAMSPR